MIGAGGKKKDTFGVGSGVRKRHQPIALLIAVTRTELSTKHVFLVSFLILTVGLNGPAISQLIRKLQLEGLKPWFL